MAPRRGRPALRPRPRCRRPDRNLASRAATIETGGALAKDRVFAVIGQDMSEGTGFLDRISNLGGSLRGAWRDIAASARGMIGNQPRPELSREAAERGGRQLRECCDARAARSRPAPRRRIWGGFISP